MDAATNPDSPPALRLRDAIVLVGLALVVTLANAKKPVHVDDAAYVLHAAHLAQHPLAPYDFDLYWDCHRQHGNDVLLPPVVPYWIATAMRVFGDDPAAWKLSFLPLHTLLAFALFAVARRFAGNTALPVTVGLVLGPAVLPGVNLMLDVPALTLGLAAAALFFRACDRGSWEIAVGAGLLAGLAMQTKYTAFVVPPLLWTYGWLFGRRLLAAAAVVAAIALFAGWEAFVALQQGVSHFQLALDRTGNGWDRARHLVLPLVTLPSALAVAALLTGLSALTRSWRWPAAVGVAVAIGFMVIGLVPEDRAVLTRSADSGAARLALESILYGTLGVAWWAVLGIAVQRLLAQPRWDRAALLLLAWLTLEVVGYFALSPFAAARRVLGVVVVATLLCARLVELQTPTRRRWLWGAAAFSAICGAVVSWVDWHEAQATQQIVDSTAAACESLGGRVWFVGTWGFQAHAQGHHFAPLEPGQTVLRRGDLLVLAEQQLKRPDFHTAQSPLKPLRTVAVEDALPWRTVPCYYCGRTPVQHHESRRQGATIYRVLADFVPRQYGVLQP